MTSIESGVESRVESGVEHSLERSAVSSPETAERGPQPAPWSKSPASGPPASPPDRSRLLFVAMIVSVVAVIIAGSLYYVAGTASVVLSVDGESQPIDTRADTVGDLLADQGVTVTADDLVTPPPDTELADDTIIEVRYARPLTVVVDGTEAVHTTTELTLDQALAAVGAPVEGAAISLPLDQELPRTGTTVTITTPKTVTLDVGGQARSFTTKNVTVGDLLATENVTVDDLDRLTPPADTRLIESMAVTVTRIRIETDIRTEPIAHETVEQNDADLTVGTRTTATEGIDGEQDVTYEVTWTNGEITSEEAIESTVTKEPVTEVVRVGTKAVVVDPGASAGGAAADLNWAALAECESSGNPKAVNPAGYYGLYQFSLATWASVGGTGNPADASVAEQTNRAQILYNKAGAGQWPHCGKYLFD